jgi:hypothetical protein
MFCVDNQAANLSEAERVQKLARHHMNPTHDAMATQFGNENSMSFFFGQRGQLPLDLRLSDRIAQLAG